MKKEGKSEFSTNLVENEEKSLYEIVKNGPM